MKESQGNMSFRLRYLGRKGVDRSAAAAQRLVPWYYDLIITTRKA
jgi:hypothetical protein